MLQQIQNTVRELGQRFGDTRIYHCQLEAATLEDNRCRLTGSVLDADTLTMIVTSLSTQFATISWDVEEVKVLRRPSPERLTVSTNVTGLHAEPSFRSEMLSQVLNGCSLELLREQDSWSFVRQADGYLGWVYRSYLEEATAGFGVAKSGVAEPSHIVSAPISLLRREPDNEAPITGRLLAGTMTTVTESIAGWRHLSLAGGLSGWAPESELRGLDALPADRAGRQQQMVRDGERFIGVPYLWGGATAFGLDCSGYVWLLHRLVGLSIPRDADMQYDAGLVAEPPFNVGDLLFFGSGKGYREITHVGMSLGGWRIIHSSRPRNGVYQDDVQATSWLIDKYRGARTFLSD